MIAHHVRAAALAMGLAVLATFSVHAQPRDGSPKNLPDPTRPSEKLKKVLSPPPPLAGPAASPGAVEKKLELRLRGRVIGKDEPLAVIEISGQVFVLPVHGEANGVKVLAITVDGVKVEAGNAKDVLVLY